MMPPVKGLCDLGGAVIPVRGGGGVLAGQDGDGRRKCTARMMCKDR
jgi:hypothetical protein